MSSRATPLPRARQELIQQLLEAGRAASDTIIMFHTVLADMLGLGASDWKALGILQRHGPMTAGELSAQTGLAPASVTGIIDRLERSGWVQRSRDPDDARRVVVTLKQETLADDLGRYNKDLFSRLEELYSVYSDAELEFLLGFLQQAEARQREATRALRESA